MRKLLMISGESFFSGVVKSGMAEIVDSLANALSKDYHVTIICPDGQSLFLKAGTKRKIVEQGVKECRFSNVSYYTISPALWRSKVASIADSLRPDVLHNFSDVDIIRRMSCRPPKTIYTFDETSSLSGKELYLLDYDVITTNSITFANEVMSGCGPLAACLKTTNFVGVTNGVLDNVLTPEKGLLIHSKYSSNDMHGKDACKNKLLRTYNIQGDPFICLFMGELIEKNGVDILIDTVSNIHDAGGVTIVCGQGNTIYEKALKDLNGKKGVRYIHKLFTPVHAFPFLAGSDFFIRPSRMEVGCLLPLTACKYGTIPVVTQVGGFADNFSSQNAIIINNFDMILAVRDMASIYSNKNRLYNLRKICMDQDFSWNTRKLKYIELYES